MEECVPVNAPKVGVFRRSFGIDDFGMSQYNVMVISCHLDDFSILAHVHGAPKFEPDPMGRRSELYQIQMWPERKRSGIENYHWQFNSNACERRSKIIPSLYLLNIAPKWHTKIFNSIRPRKSFWSVPYRIALKYCIFVENPGWFSLQNSDALKCWNSKKPRSKYKSHYL